MNAIAWFAQIAAPAPADIAAFLGCLFFLVAGWNQLERFLDRRTRRPDSPPSPDTAPDPSRAELAELQRHLAKIDREVGELRTSLDLAHHQLARVEAKLDRVVERNLA